MTLYIVLCSNFGVYTCNVYFKITFLALSIFGVLDKIVLCFRMKLYILCIVRWLGRECNTSKFEETPLELKFGLVAPITSDEKYILQFEQINL